MSEPRRRPTESLDEAYFDKIYSTSDDPWGFETREYEREKYARTIAMLPRERYRRCLEIGCSVGVLSGLLLERCDALFATEINDRALAAAQRRHAGRATAQLVKMNFPEQVPPGTFDLVVLSEVAYYWAAPAFRLAQRLILDQLLESGGTLMLVHYTPVETDYPMTGDEVHEAYVTESEEGDARLKHVGDYRGEQYRIDVFERRLR